METHSDDVMPATAQGENPTLLDGVTPGEEVDPLSVSAPMDNAQAESTLVNDSVSTEIEGSAPMVDLSGADNIQEKEPVPVTADLSLSHSKTISDTVQFDKEVISDSRTNALWIVCQVCKSKILQPNVGAYLESEAELPPLLKKESLNTATQEIPVERVTEFWKIKDMFYFENIGVSKTINNTKYLLCADCEIGPVGYHLTTNPQAFFLAANRVVYAKTL